MAGPWPEAEAPAAGGWGGVELGVGHLDRFGGAEIKDGKPESKRGAETDLIVGCAEADQDWFCCRGQGVAYGCMEVILSDGEDMYLVG